MKLSQTIKPISYLKAHAADIIKSFKSGDTQELIITQNGEAKAVLLDIARFEKMQDSLTMLKLLAQSNASIQESKTKPAKKAFADIRQKVKDSK